MRLILKLTTFAVPAFALIQPSLASAPVAAPLSVLTYNVEGLPWPARWNRAADLASIGSQLRDLRAKGTQPHVIILQEAFSDDAKAIARTAGYRYIADGPSRELGGAPATSPADRAFVAGASVWRGETQGKWADSGLRIASDYPILAIRRMAFPAYACAGLDCLANKGVVAVSVRVPNVPTPVAIVATHLNSRRASRAEIARSLYAYQRQVDALRTFLQVAVPSRYPMIFAGDFNAGQQLARRSYLVRSAATWRDRQPITVALESCLANAGCAKRDAADIRFSFARGRDWQFFSPGMLADLRVTAVSGLFGHGIGGAMLSDHVGYVASYRLGRALGGAPLRLAAQ